MLRGLASSLVGLAALAVATSGAAAGGAYSTGGTFDEPETFDAFPEEKLPDASGLHPVGPVGAFTSTDDMFDAAKHNDLKGVQKAMMSGARIDKPDANGLTCMHYACRRMNLKMVEALFDAHFTNIDAVDENGVSALALAAEHGFLAGATLLIKAGADANTVDRYGLTALMRAARGSDTVDRMLLIQRLMNAGAKHLLQDHEGDTALMIAENQGNRIIVGFLRQLNADGHVRISDDEMTPAEKAAKALRERVDAAFNTDTAELLRREQRSISTYKAAAIAKAEEHEHKLALNLLEREDAEKRAKQNEGFHDPNINSEL